VKYESGKRATVVGGSIGGLFAGHYLLKIGWDVHIYETVEDGLASRGAGVTTQPELLDAMRELGIPIAEDFGMMIKTRKTLALDGSVYGTHELEQIVTSWGHLYQLLRATFPKDRYHQGKTVDSCHADSQQVTTRFTDNQSIEAELLVAADGIRSTLRRQLEPDSQPEYVGYIAWRGLVDEARLNATELLDIFPYFTFCLPPGEQVLGYPVAGEDHGLSQGHRRYNVVWYRPADADTVLRDMLTDSEGNTNGVSIAPNRIREEVVDAMREASRSLLSPQHAALIEKVDSPFIQPVYDLTTTRMAYNRIAILGDAAFTARPHLGMGITKAAEDAQVLASCLTQHATVEKALENFDSIRRPLNTACVQRSRQLGAYLQAQQQSDAERANAKRHRSPEAVMRETATSAGLQRA